ncbi:S46 family peptidase [Ancylomarina sp. 16SWW S1-10-2]|uniref:S46 family peptidase n=1 Tax=Ancylomarina sp. 16SWW S1-10-2 TaxID=2499681 RepID=UPI001D69383D|nr:hypothetical protein [Ancylomarina sp. 16SWW S1-10-2]
MYQKLTELGLEIDPNLLLNIKDSDCLSRSVVYFNGSCSGVIISPKGLLMTNYHCCSPQILDKIPNYKETLEKLGNMAFSLRSSAKSPPGVSKILLITIEMAAPLFLNRILSTFNLKRFLSQQAFVT